MEKAGSWVRAFQSIDPEPGRMSVDALRSYIDIRLERLVSAPPASFGESDRARVLEYIGQLYATASADDRLEVPIHGDLAPANMLVSGDRVIVLDFAMCGRGSVLHDLSRLYLQVDLLRLKPQFSGSVVDSLGRSLLRGFDPQLTPDRPMFRLLLMQHRINHLATLSLNHERFPANLYSRRVRRHHRAHLERELCRFEDGADR
jgi:Ser/Thr protein kinase RdoA (MazF antagonist)